MQMPLDFTVLGREELDRHRERAEALGARPLQDRMDDPTEPLYVLADPSGHPFLHLRCRITRCWRLPPRLALRFEPMLGLFRS